MKRHLDIQIKNPCSENWNNFAKVGNIGFCGKCQHSVIDFTSSTDKEIQEYFIENNEEICGRFKPQQLQSYSKQQQRNFTFRNAFLLTAGFFSVATISKSSVLNERVSLLNEPVNSISVNQVSAKIDDGIISNKFRFFGIVSIEEDSEKVAGAEVQIIGTNEKTLTDANGHFEIFYTGKEEDEIIFKFFYPGCEPTERKIIVASDQSDLGNTILKNDPFELEKIIVVGYGIQGKALIVNSPPPRKNRWSIKRLFRRNN